MIKLNNKRRIIFCLVLLIGLSFIGCLRAWAIKEYNYGGSNNRGENSDFSDKYYYEMDKKHQLELLENLKLIKLGSSVDEVIKILGKPTSDENLYSKKGVFKCRYISYYLKRWRKDLVNEKHDKLVWLVFDSKNNLIRIGSNVNQVDKQ